MRKSIIEAVKKYGWHDTKNYRYQAEEINTLTYQAFVIKRIDINMVGSTEALDPNNWEIVYEEK